jgi:hypothetical protein
MIGFLLVAALGGGCAPEPRDLAQLTVADSLYVDPASGAPFSGPVVRYFTASGEGLGSASVAVTGEGDITKGTVQLEGTLREGVWDGELVVYHPNGRVRYMGSFARGERCGPWVENADSTPTLSTYEDLVREVESMGLYPSCDGSS